MQAIDQAAAEAVFAGRDHLCHVRVTGARQLLAQSVPEQYIALAEKKRVGGQKLDGRQALRVGSGFGHHEERARREGEFGHGERVARAMKRAGAHSFT